DRQREVRVQAARLGARRGHRDLPAAHRAQRDPPTAPRAPAPPRPHGPPDVGRRDDLLLATRARPPLADRPGGHRRRRAQPRPVHHARGHRRARPVRARRARAGAGDRPGHAAPRGERRALRGDVLLGPHPVLPARPAPQLRTRAGGEAAVSPNNPARALAARTDPIPRLGHGARPGLTPDPDWYRTAVFYEVPLRAFGDSDGSGTGDLRGLIDRLDYLQWLGVD